MKNYFCKNSVFSILFFAFFSIGTICGVLLFRLVLMQKPEWITDYCKALRRSDPGFGFRQLLFFAWPFLSVVAVGLTPLGKRCIPALIALRGCLLAYTCAGFYISGISYSGFFLRNIPLISLYFLLCAFFYHLSLSGRSFVRI